MRSTTVGLAMATAALAGACQLAYRLTIRHGQLLLQVEALERQVAELGQQMAVSPGQRSSQPLASSNDPADDLSSLPVGMVTPDFELPDLAGGRVTLSQWRGQRVLMIFFDPTCGFSREMLPGLAALPPYGLSDHAVPLVISRGHPEANRRLMRAHGVRCPVLLQDDREVASMYGVDASPVGYLIDERGRTVSPLAVGPEALLALAGARSAYTYQQDGQPGSGVPTPGRAPRLFTRWAPMTAQLWNGLPAGTPAPDFRVPALAGGEISLSQHLGRPVLLVFSDPSCAPCDELAPELEAVQQQAPVLQVLMVNRGDLDANRQKAAEHGLTFPIGLQPHWTVSRSYGILGAPIAFLIDERGTIAADVAVGLAAIRALAWSTVAAQANAVPDRRNGEVLAHLAR